MRQAGRAAVHINWILGKASWRTHLHRAGTVTESNSRAAAGDSSGDRILPGEDRVCPTSASATAACAGPLPLRHASTDTDSPMSKQGAITPSSVLPTAVPSDKKPILWNAVPSLHTTASLMKRALLMSLLPCLSWDTSCLLWLHLSGGKDVPMPL